MVDQPLDIESLIEDYAERLSRRMAEAMPTIHNEEDLRVRFTRVLDDFIDAADLRIEGRHEYGLEGGRVDSKYAGVLFEFKSPVGSARLTADPNAAPNRALTDQLEQRFEAADREPHLDPERLLGVGTDGCRVVTARCRGKKVYLSPPHELTDISSQPILRALVSLGARGRPFTADQLREDFGSDSKSAQAGVAVLYQALLETDAPRAKVLFGQWEVYFSEVTGYDPKRNRKHLAALRAAYGIDDSTADPSALLFAVHTYYALLIKLLAAEIVAAFNPVGTSVIRRCVAAGSDASLAGELRNLESGGIWSQLGISNFLEGDIFTWYLDVWSSEVARSVREMIRNLDQYDPATVSVDPDESQDLLKKLYQNLLPEEVRHGLGEYYTPDWLAEHVLDRVGWDGDPRKRLLDPACGSGTFLVSALKRARRWYRDNGQLAQLTASDFLSLILGNICGFDLNPLAVLAARTNYLIAVRDLLKHLERIELPVYLCDSVMTPSEYGDLFTAGHGGHRRLRTTVGDFLVPGTVAQDQAALGKYTETLERAISHRIGSEAFVDEVLEAGLGKPQESDLHVQLYEKLIKLSDEDRNGVWARILKNAFAPLFKTQVDFVVGNPPWVNWEHLPTEYRKSTEGLWQQYGLFELKGYDAKLGGAKDDISILMTYVAHDRYLKTGGTLGFVITQSVFKTKGGGAGFRSFQYESDTGRTYIIPRVVEDFTDFQPFEGVSNRTSVVVLGKASTGFEYPVPYRVWEKRWGASIGEDDSLQMVRERTLVSDYEAVPVDDGDSQSPWITAPPKVVRILSSIGGSSRYRGRKG